MDDSLAHVVGTPLTVTLREKEYKIAPLRLGDIAEFESYIRSRKLKELLNATESLDIQDKQQLINILLATDVTPEEIVAESSKISGMRFLAFLALKRHNPEIKILEQVDDLIGLDNLEEVGAILDIQAGGTGRPPQPPVQPEGNP